MLELSKQVRFDVARALHRVIGAASSHWIQDRSYRTEVTLRGLPDPDTGGKTCTYFGPHGGLQ